MKLIALLFIFVISYILCALLIGGMIGLVLGNFDSMLVPITHPFHELAYYKDMTVKVVVVTSRVCAIISIIDFLVDSDI